MPDRKKPGRARRAPAIGQRTGWAARLRMDRHAGFIAAPSAGPPPPLPPPPPPLLLLLAAGMASAAAATPLYLHVPAPLGRVAVLRSPTAADARAQPDGDILTCGRRAAARTPLAEQRGLHQGVAQGDAAASPLEAGRRAGRCRRADSLGRRIEDLRLRRCRFLAEKLRGCDFWGYLQEDQLSVTFAPSRRRDPREARHVLPAHASVHARRAVYGVPQLTDDQRAVLQVAPVALRRPHRPLPCI